MRPLNSYNNEDLEIDEKYIMQSARNKTEKWINDFACDAKKKCYQKIIE